MECSATPWRLWRESRNLQIFTEPSYPEKTSFSLFCRELFSFCHFNSVRACLQALGLARGAGTWVKCKKENNSLQKLCELSLFVNSLRVCKQNFLKLQEFLIMKNYGITLTRGNYETSGRQNCLRSLWSAHAPINA